jgi:hypothetical protein
MAFNDKSLDDYVDVAQRLADFRDLYPEGSLQPADPSKPWEQAVVNGFTKGGEAFAATMIVYVAAAYRTPGDTRPGIGIAWEPFPGRTPYTLGSELMNAETSAWGRAILAVLASDSKKGVASRQEVKARRLERDADAPQQNGNGRASAWGADAEYERSVTGPPEGTPEEHARTQRTRGPIPADADRWDAQPAGPPLTQPEDQPGNLDRKQQARMFALFAEVGLAGQDEAQRGWLTETLHREVASRKSLTWKETDQAVKALAEWAANQKLPGSAGKDQVGAIATLYASKLGYKRTETPQMLGASEQIIGRSLEGPDGERTHQNLSAAEARKLHDTLAAHPDRAGLEDWLKSPAEATP